MAIVTNSFGLKTNGTETIISNGSNGGLETASNGGVILDVTGGGGGTHKPARGTVGVATQYGLK